ncbi:MAG: hypothetical protein GX638_09025 [Crenarchaeota archaeon]|nr:hypothetical protein [Thermoproteota archaeon]
MDKRFIEQKTLYVTWEDIDNVLQELLDDNTFETKREDFYYFSGYSEAHDKDYEDEELLQRIGDYLKINIVSYHTDDEGIWIVIR